MATRYEISVQGMACDRCRQRVERTLRAQPGVAAVEVSLADARATVEAPAGAADALRAAIEGAGYRVGSVSESAG
jgi:copper chaperone CopZ